MYNSSEIVNIISHSLDRGLFFVILKENQKVTHGAYKQHSPPELTNLMQGRQN
jgi:hypothetical protein